MIIAKIEVYGNNSGELARNLENLIQELNQAADPEDAIEIAICEICALQYQVKLEVDTRQFLTEKGPMPDPGNLLAIEFCARCNQKIYSYERAKMYMCDCHKAG